MKIIILIILSVIGLAYSIYWIREIIMRALKEAYDLGYKNGARDTNELYKLYSEK